MGATTCVCDYVIVIAHVNPLGRQDCSGRSCESLSLEDYAFGHDDDIGPCGGRDIDLPSILT